MKFILCLTLTWLAGFLHAQEKSIVEVRKDGAYTLSADGASYFAKLSLECVERPSPHFIDRVYENRYQWGFLEIDSTIGDDYWPSLRGLEEQPSAKDLWPSFYGCFDWHSSVHNHWCLVKLLKSFPDIPEAQAIRERLNQSFDPRSIEKELRFVQSHEFGIFEFPYGQSWLLKVADELSDWDDPDASLWLENLLPLSDYIAAVHIWYWRNITPKKRISGSHDSPSMGLAFAHDYALTFNHSELQKVIDSTAIAYYLKSGYKDLAEEPIGYDFMSGGLLVTDIMRKVLSPKKLKKWLKSFAPELLNLKDVEKVMLIKKTEKHDEYESHWDGYHLNRIWCLNGLLISLDRKVIKPELRNAWTTNMNDMWDYAQKSIGIGNYDIDHWLSSFSVFALIGCD
jgi:hypothetical protein